MHVPAVPYQELPGIDLKARTQPCHYTRLSRFARHTENMSTENPTVALEGLTQGTFNFVQAITAWDGHATV